MAGNWQSIALPPSGFSAETMLLLTDGDGAGPQRLSGRTGCVSCPTRRTGTQAGGGSGPRRWPTRGASSPRGCCRTGGSTRSAARCRRQNGDIPQGEVYDPGRQRLDRR